MVTRQLLQSLTLKTNNITTSAGSNGTINPSEATVDHGSDQTFTITPDPNYHILDVKVDGESVGAVDSYAFDNVTEDGHTISAAFVYALDHFTFASIGGQKAGTAFAITITAKDVNDNIATGYAGTGTLTDTTGTISPNSINFSNGVGTGKVTITVAQNNVVVTIYDNGVQEIAVNFMFENNRL